MQAVKVVVLDGDGSDWVRAHEALSRLAKERAMADAEEGRWLLAALRSAAHVHMGFGAFGEYIERLLAIVGAVRKRNCASPKRSSDCRQWPWRWTRGR